MLMITTLTIVLTGVVANGQNCPDGGTVYERGISANGKTSVVNAHNKYRLDIANGRVLGQPRGINLKSMVYDDSLGNKGRVVSNTCKMAHVKISDNRFNVGQNLFISWDYNNTPGQNWTGAVAVWFNEHSDFTYPSTSRGVTGHYTQVVWAESYKLGCDFIRFYDKTKPKTPYAKLYTCNYGPGGNKIGQAPYKTGRSGCENLC